jgi:hypothetical protein
MDQSRKTQSARHHTIRHSDIGNLVSNAGPLLLEALTRTSTEEEEPPRRRRWWWRSSWRRLRRPAAAAASSARRRLSCRSQRRPSPRAPAGDAKLEGVKVMKQIRSGRPFKFQVLVTESCQSRCVRAEGRVRVRGCRRIPRPGSRCFPDAPAAQAQPGAASSWQTR